MRIWEFQDNNAIPSDLVREQDFILRLRREQRQGQPCLVINFILNALEPLAKSRPALEVVQKKLQAFARTSSGDYFEMSNGDAFIVWERPGDVQIMASKAIEETLSEYKSNTSQFLLNYHLPENYTQLRERANHYIEVVHAAASVSGGFSGESMRGNLTAKNVDQIQHILGEIDLRRYGRTQRIYKDAAGVWQPLGEEYFISFEDLRREHFPKLEIGASEHFFFSLCGTLDQKLLAMLTNSFEIIDGRAINLNLSIATIMGSVFAQFVRRVPHEHRPLICFELHRGDVFQDFSLTLSAISVLKREGFRVALDSVTPEMVNYLNLPAFAVDAVKINVSKDRAQQLQDPAIRKALERLAAEKLIFFRCDNEHALAIGRELGVSVFQGWLIDDLVGKKN